MFEDDLEIFGKAVTDVIYGNTTAFDALTQAQKQIDNK
jgi:hypothetical protein